jgi:hypothetical protein
MAANLGWCAAFVTMAVASLLERGAFSMAALPLFVGMAVFTAVQAWEARR